MTARTEWLVLGNAMLGNFLSGLSTRTFLIGLPTVAAGLGTDILGISWALIAFQLASISLSIVFGRLGDIYGRQGIYGLGFVTITVSAVLCGLAQNIAQLVVFRVLQGVGAAMTQSAARALAVDAMPEGSVGKAQGFMTLAFHCGFLVGPPLGGFIVEHLNWRWIFFLLVPIGLAGVAFTSLGLRARTPPHRGEVHRPVDYAGALMFIALMVLVITLLDRRIAGYVSTGPRSLLAVALGGILVGFLVRESRVPSPLMNLSLFRIRMFAYSVVSLLSLAVTYGLVDFMMPFYLQEVLHLAPSFIGIIFLAAPICTIALAPLSGYLADRIGPRIPATMGVIPFVAASVLGMLLRADSHWSLPTAMLALIGVGNALFNAPNHAAVFNAVPKEERGFATGAIYTVFGFGHMLGVSLSGVLLTIAFQHYSGMPGATPSPADAPAFVSSMNVSYGAALIMSLVALGFSAMRGDAKNPGPRTMASSA